MLSEIDVFFDLLDFATSATYKVAGTGNGSTILVIFDKDPDLLSIGGEVEIQTTGPTAVCKTSDVSAVTNASTLTIASVVYKVIQIDTDANGFTLLHLSKD